MVHAMNYSVEARPFAPSGWHRHDAEVAKWRESLGDNKAPPEVIPLLLDQSEFSLRRSLVPL
jgi:hypothetical protein